MDEKPHDRRLDLESLKALAHPLRVQIIDTLSTYGSFTASGLAERLGESSGATSYHLRQLEKHGFVREVEGKGVGRERWWERTPGGLMIAPSDDALGPAGRDATRLVVQHWHKTSSAKLDQFLEHGEQLLTEEWFQASTILSANVKLTLGQLKELSAAWEALAEEYLARYRGQNVSGARPVQVQFAAFPIVDGTETSDAVQSTSMGGEIS